MTNIEQKLKIAMEALDRILDISENKAAAIAESALEEIENIFEELPDSNLQKEKKVQVNPGEYVKTPNPIDLEELSKVKRALDESKRILRERYSNPEYGQELLADALKNLVIALEAEKFRVLTGLNLNDVILERDNYVRKKLNMSKEEPKWQPISSAPKCGSPITVMESTNRRYKIFRAQWFLNKWFSLYKDGGNEEVYPEFWLKGSKEEPKIDMKEKCVESVLEAEKAEMNLVINALKNAIKQMKDFNSKLDKKYPIVKGYGEA